MTRLIENEVYTLQNFIKQEKVRLSMNTDEIVHKYKLYNLAPEDLLSREARLFRAFTCNIQMQKNKLFLSELTNIMKFASSDMKIVLFKGLSLAYNYYTNPEERLFNDVDIFTHDVNKVINLLISQGYSLEKQYKSRYYLYMGECYEPDSNGYFNKLNLNHIECYKDVNNMCIVIEIHKNILNKLRYPDVNQDEIYERCTSNFLDINAVFELEKHDLLLYQVCHFSTHLCAYMSYIDKDRLETLPSIPIRYIHDIMYEVESWIIHCLDCTVLHSAGVRLCGKNIALIGQSMSGKSTLTHYLCKREDGKYFDDDCIYLHKNKVWGFNFPMALRALHDNCQGVIGYTDDAVMKNRCLIDIDNKIQSSGKMTLFFFPIIINLVKILLIKFQQAICMC